MHAVWWPVSVSPISTGWRLQALHISPLLTPQAPVSFKLGWTCYARTSADCTGRAGCVAATKHAHNDPGGVKSPHNFTQTAIPAAGPAGAQVDLLGFACQRRSGGARSPSFYLRSACYFCAWQSWLAGAAQAFKGGSEGLVYHTKLRSAAAARDRAAWTLSLMHILRCLARLLATAAPAP